MEMSKFSARRKQSKRAPLTSEGIPDLASLELNYMYMYYADRRDDCSRQSKGLPFSKVFDKSNLSNILIADVKINPDCEIYLNLYWISQKYRQNNLLKNLNLSVIYINIVTLLLLVYRYWKIYLIQVRLAQVNDEIILHSITSLSLS